MTTVHFESPSPAEVARAVASERGIDPSAISVEIVEVTPDIAREWLARNVHNRRLSQLRINVYSRDIAAGHWRLTGEAVQFDTDGNLIDGQHRLWGVIQAETPAPFLVVRGLPPETQDFIDTGQKRTMGQVLQLRGADQPNVVAAAATLLYQWEQRDRFRDANSQTGRSVSHAEITDVIAANPGLTDVVGFARSRGITGITVSVRAFVLYMLRKIDRDAADEFMADLSAMRTEGLGDPKAALLKRLGTAATDRTRITRYDQAKLLFRTWNAVRRGEQVHRVQVWVRGASVEPEDPI